MRKEINESLDLLLQKDHLPHISIVATVVLMICIIGPYLEELLFRGIFKRNIIYEISILATIHYIFYYF